MKVDPLRQHRSAMSTANENRNSTKISHHSKNLSRDENELVFQLIGRKCVSLCTTVAQVYETEPPSVGWNKKGTGVLCFIKDNGKRSYYCRLVCLINHRVIWEQEMYDTIEMGQSQSYLITFEGEVSNFFFFTHLMQFAHFHVIAGRHRCAQLCIRGRGEKLSQCRNANRIEPK